MSGVATDTWAISNLKITATKDTVSQGELYALDYDAEAQDVSLPADSAIFSATGHGLAEDDPVTFAGYALAGGMTFGDIYYVVYIDADTFSVSATAPGSAITFTTAGSNIRVSKATYSYDKTVAAIGSDDGIWVFTITATDLAGRTTSLTRTVFIDATAPTNIAITDPELYLSGNGSTIVGTVDDGNGTGINNVQYLTRHGTPVSLNSGTDVFTAVGHGFAAGVPIVFRGDAEAGNMTFGTRYYIVDDGTLTADTFTVDDDPAASTPVDFSSDGTNLRAKRYWSLEMNTTLDSDTDIFTAANHALEAGTAITFSGATAPEGSTSLVFGTTYYVSTVSLTQNGFRIADSESTLDTPMDFTSIGSDLVATVKWNAAIGKTNWAVSLNLDTDGPGNDTGLVEGPYTLYIRAIDLAGNVTSWSSVENLDFDVDQANPLVTTIKADGADFPEMTIYKTADLTLSGLAYDSNGVASLTVTQKKDATDPITISDIGTLSVGTTNRPWSLDTQFSGEGSYLYTITATDLVGRSYSTTRTIVVDEQDPALPLVTSTDDGHWFSDMTVSFNGTAADNGAAGIQYVYFGFEDRTYTPPALGDPFWTAASINGSGAVTWGPAQVTVSNQGEWALFLRSVDRAGRVSALQTLNFGVDTQSPTIDASTSPLTYVIDDFVLSGNADDSNEVAFVTVAELQPGEGTEFEIPVANKSTGQRYRIVNLGTSTNWSDMGADADPAVGEYFIATGTAPDGTGTIMEASVATYDGGTNTWSLPVLVGSRATGDYYYKITVVDVSGKTVSVDKQLYLDKILPTTSFNLSAPGISNLDVNPVDATAILSGHNYIITTLGDTVWSTLGESSPTLGKLFTAIADGNVGSGTGTTVEAIAATALTAGNSYIIKSVGSTDWHAIGLASDVSAATDVVFTATGAGSGTGLVGGLTVYGNAGMTVSGKASDAKNLSGLRIKIGSADWVDIGVSPFTSFSQSFDTTDYITYGHSDDSELLIQLEATDVPGNTRVASYRLYVLQSTDQPVIAISSPAQNEEINTQTFAVSGTVTDDDGVGIAASAVQYRFSPDNGSSWNSWTDVVASGPETNRSFTISVTSATSGIKQIEMRAVDKNAVGAENLIRTFSQDIGAPTLSGITPKPNSYFNLDSILVQGTATDNNNVASVEIRVLVNGTEQLAYTPATLGSGTTVRTFSYPVSTAWGTGTYQIIIKPTDGAGNAREDSIQIKIDKTAPNIYFSTPTENQEDRNNFITLSGLADDDNDGFGLQSVQWAIR
ncbi:MAG: Ig-like domain-containing protein [bacterium]